MDFPRCLVPDLTVPFGRENTAAVKLPETKVAGKTESRIAEASCLGVPPPRIRKPLSDSSPQVGGRLSHFLPAWKKISSNSWILGIIRRGLTLEFKSRPKNTVKISAPRGLVEQIALQQEVLSLLRKGVLVETPAPEQGRGFYSTLFLIKKPDGSFRTIANLKRLNDHLIYRPFKMETIKSAIKMLFPDCFMCVLDLKDAYYHVPILPDHQQFLRVAVQFGRHVRHFQFAALPFGISMAPRVFTKIILEVTAHLRERDILVIPYLDDFLVVGRSSKLCALALADVMASVRRLGWLLNLEKSRLEPKRVQSFLGLILDSENQTCLLPEEKKLKIRSLTSQIVSNPTITLRSAMSVGYNDVLHSGGSVGPAPFQMSSTGDSGSGQAAQRSPEWENISSRCCDQLPGLVDISGQPIFGGSLDLPGVGYNYNRRKCGRLGSSPKGSFCTRPLVGQRDKPLFQHERAVGSQKRAKRIQFCSSGSSRQDNVRQQINSRLHQSSGGYQVSPSDVNSGSDLQVCRESAGYALGTTYKRGREHKGRFLESSHLETRRVGVESSRFSADCGSVGTAPDRSVCKQTQSEDRNLLLPESKRGGVCCGRAADSVGFHSSLCLSPFSTDPYYPEEDPRGTGEGYIDRPVLAQETMVHLDEENVPSRSMGSSGHPGSPQAGPSLSSPKSGPAFDGLDFERSLLTQRGFSPDLVTTLLASRKPITTRIYGRTWAKFLSTSGQSAKGRVPIEAILEFLQKGLNMGLATSTLKVQVSALGALYN
ncbi:uncharacterized protein [Phyllobates terribilis]|uniref:uncharacterized protein n=1 Tax=Phyllobates terribilis TaxID=111132 RepID=UPI003CCAD74F